MRPTIPLDAWRLAVDLAATRAVAAVEERPVRGCDCPWCRNWRAAVDEALPPVVRQQLRRIGIDPADPTDLYACEEAGDRLRYRVTYHCVGTVLSGPAPRREHERLGALRTYRLLGAGLEPGLSVAYARDVGGVPGWATGAMAPLVQVDFRLPVPWRLPGERPSIYAGSGNGPPRGRETRGRRTPPTGRRVPPDGTVP